MLVINMSELLRSQYVRLMRWISELDRKLSIRHGDRYDKVKQQFSRVGNWYEKTRLEAKSSGVIPLEQKQAELGRQLAEAGVHTAQKEGVVKMQLKQLWRTLKNI